MTIVAVGYIKDFEKKLVNKSEPVFIIEGISERIDYIRSNNLEQKNSFTLIPKFVTNAVETGKQITVFIQKIDILSTLRKKRKITQFGQVQSTPFYDSRQILVTTQKLKDINPIDVLIINWGSLTDTIGYLKSTETHIYDIQTILIHKTAFSDQISTFLNKVHFVIKDQDTLPSTDAFGKGTFTEDYIQFRNNKPNIKSFIFKNEDELLEYAGASAANDAGASAANDADIFAINWGTEINSLPFAKFFPCKHMTIYFDSKSHSERIKDTILFGNTQTMIHLAQIINNKRILFLDTLKSEGFFLNEF